MTARSDALWLLIVEAIIGLRHFAKIGPTRPEFLQALPEDCVKKTAFVQLLQVAHVIEVLWLELLRRRIAKCKSVQHCLDAFVGCVRFLRYNFQHILVTFIQSFLIIQAHPFRHRCRTLLFVLVDVSDRFDESSEEVQDHRAITLGKILGCVDGIISPDNARILKARNRR